MAGKRGLDSADCGPYSPVPDVELELRVDATRDTLFGASELENTEATGDSSCDVGCEDDDDGLEDFSVVFCLRLRSSLWDSSLDLPVAEG